MGLNGSKSMLTFFSFPSSVTMVPQYITKPLGGTTTIQTQINSKDPSNDPNQTFKTYIEILDNTQNVFSTLVHMNQSFKITETYKLINTKCQFCVYLIGKFNMDSTVHSFAHTIIAGNIIFFL